MLELAPGDPLPQSYGTLKEQLLRYRLDFLVNRDARERMLMILLQMPSDMMDPEIGPTDFFAAKPVGEWKGDAVYVYRLGESINVFQLQRFPNDITRVTSPNPYYNSYDLKPEHDWDPLAIVTGSFRVIYSPDQNA